MNKVKDKNDREKVKGFRDFSNMAAGFYLNGCCFCVVLLLCCCCAWCVARAAQALDSGSCRVNKKFKCSSGTESSSLGCKPVTSLQLDSQVCYEQEHRPDGTVGEDKQKQRSLVTLCCWFLNPVCVCESACLFTCCCLLCDNNVVVYEHLCPYRTASSVSDRSRLPTVVWKNNSLSVILFQVTCAWVSCRSASKPHYLHVWLPLSVSRLTGPSGFLTDGPGNYKYKTKCTWLIEGQWVKQESRTSYQIYDSIRPVKTKPN